MDDDSVRMDQRVLLGLCGEAFVKLSDISLLAIDDLEQANKKCIPEETHGLKEVVNVATLGVDVLKQNISESSPYCLESFQEIIHEACLVSGRASQYLTNLAQEKNHHHFFEHSKVFWLLAGIFKQLLAAYNQGKRGSRKRISGENNVRFLRPHS